MTEDTRLHRNRKLAWWKVVVVPVLGILFVYLGGLTPYIFSHGASPESEPVLNSSSSPRMIRGRVLDARTLSPVADAQVQIEFPIGVDTTRTDRQGIFQIRFPTALKGESFRIRIEAETYKIYLQETDVNLSEGRLIEYRLEPTVSQTVGGSSEVEGVSILESAKTPIIGSSPRVSGLQVAPTGLVEITEGDAEFISALNAMVGVRFRIQERQQTAVLTLSGPKIDFSRAFFGPGGRAQINSPAGVYTMTLFDWDPTRRKAWVAVHRSF